MNLFALVIFALMIMIICLSLALVAINGSRKKCPKGPIILLEDTKNFIQCEKCGVFRESADDDHFKDCIGRYCLEKTC